ncbi:hypothetical protein [Brevundimonas sp.]|uniref:hypothetical protein n=1 Tax=Brevundimonas sp. TaxID=1871086 RepID=UPI0039E490EB
MAEPGWPPEVRIADPAWKHEFRVRPWLSYERWIRGEIRRHGVMSLPFPEALRADLVRIVPAPADYWSGAHYWPCEVQLKSGAWLDRVCIIRGVDTHHGGLLPLETHILPQDIVALRESPTRLPPPYINRILAGETLSLGMTGAVVEVVFDDGSTLIVGGDASFEFPAYPQGKAARNVVDVRLPEGEWSERVSFPEAPIWCLIL